MRILLVNYEWPGVTANCGGGGTVSKELRDGLDARGHEVRVMTDIADRHYTTFPIRAYRRLREDVAWADVVNGHFSLPSSLPLPHLCARTDTPLAVSVMGADVYDPTRYNTLRPALDAANRYVFDRADAVIAPSTDMQQRVADLGTDAHVIHYGINPNAWTWRRRECPDRPTVLTVCRLVERKNLGVAREAIRRLDRPVDWRVVGTGPVEETMASWPEANTAGYVDDLQAAYDAADVFFLPSKHEAFGMVFLEALACGLPVVTSSSGGQTDIVANGSVGRCGPPTPGEQARLLGNVCDRYDQYQHRTNGYVANNFSREQMVDQYERLFQTLT